MDAQINYTLEDGTNLSKTVDEQIGILKAEGFDEESNVKLKAALAELTSKEVVQGAAVNQKDKKVAAKEKVVAKAVNLVKRLRDAVRGAFGEDKKKLKQYKADERLTSGVNTLSSMCEYLAPVAAAEINVLNKNGFNQQDLDNLTAMPELIRNAGSDSKRALKQQKSATILRNDAADEVDKLTRKIRRFVKARFSEKPEVMVLFEPVPKGRGNAAEETPAPPAAEEKKS